MNRSKRITDTSSPVVRWCAVAGGCCLLAGAWAGLPQVWPEASRASRIDVPLESAARFSNASGLLAPAFASARQVGRSRRFRPSARGALAARRAIIDGMSCQASSAVLSVAHIEVFAEDRVVVVPAGIGVAPPLRRQGAYVSGGSCVYPLHTLEPTGLVLIGPGRPHTLGQFFEVWGQPLGDAVVAGFRAARGDHVAVYIDGITWRGNPTAAPLTPHAQVTIEVGPRVPPHARYVFPRLPLETP